MDKIINEQNINELLNDGKTPDSQEILEIIEKAKDLNGLTLKETATLLNCNEKELINKIFESAKYIKESIYGNRIVLFAPLYLTNECTNSCLYCGFRKENKGLARKTLSLNEIENEVKLLEKEGHKRLLLVAGEDEKISNISYIEDAIKTVYCTKIGTGEIRRVNVNIAPLSIENFKVLKNLNIGTYQLFQETYHRNTYNKVHPAGIKSDYDWRLYGMDRAFEAGLNDLGIGVLFGLHNYKFEVLSLLSHAQYLENKFGAGPHTISVPRIKPAHQAPLSQKIPCPVSDEDFKKIVAIIRLAVPYTGIILTTREPASLRNELFSLGISQISAGSKTNPGGYSKSNNKEFDSEQFELEDTRTQLEIVKDILRQGFLPSFCTSCYRTGRVGKDFMHLAKPGDIKYFCLPNCVLTFKEYVLDYGDQELNSCADEIINKEIADIQDNSIKERTVLKIRDLENGKRDLYF